MTVFEKKILINCLLKKVNENRNGTPNTIMIFFYQVGSTMAANEEANNLVYP